MHAHPGFGGLASNSGRAHVCDQVLILALHIQSLQYLDAGSASGKWGGYAGQQQAALEQLFPDMRPQAPQPPPYPQRQDQPQLATQQPPQLIAAGAPGQPADDILAGDIDQLNDHLHTARFCNGQKTAPGAAHPPADGPPLAQPAGPPLHSSAHSGGQPQAAQQKGADGNASAPLHDRSRPKERYDRWQGANGMYPSGRLAQSNSPPMTPAYAQHGTQVPAHLLQHQFPGHAFMPPSREMRQSQQQQQLQRQAYMHAQHQQSLAMSSWHPQPPRTPSVDDLYGGPAAAATEASGHHTTAPFSHPRPPPPISAPPPGIDPEQLLASQDWEAAGSSNPPSVLVVNGHRPNSPAPPPVPNGPLAAATSHGPASVDSPPAPKGIWGDGLHQQRLSNLANDLASVRVAPGVRASAEAPAASAAASSRREAAPSSSRSAGSTPQAGDTHRARANFPFDSAAALNKRRQRLPHNASAHELGQSAPEGAAGPEAPGKRDRTAKLSLDSLTSQAEAAQRQQALAGFELNTADFPALGGMGSGPSVPASPGSGAGSRAAHGKAWSETDALSPPVHKPLPE